MINIPELQQLDRIQAEIFARLGSDPFFSDIPLVLVRPGLISQDILTSLGTLNSKTGKQGIVVLVNLPEFASDNSNSPGLQGHMVPSLRVLEQETFNSDPATGTLKSCSMVALRAARVLQMYQADGVTRVMTVEKKALRPYTGDLKIGLVGQDVLLSVPGGLTGGDKVAKPTITGPAGAVVLTCSTPGSTIYYTLDGSYPGSGNVDANGTLLAQLYAAPFAVAPGTTVRAGAQTADLVPSNTSSLTL